MMILDIYALKPEVRAAKEMTATIYGQKYLIQTAEQKTGFGIKKFLLCPVCGKRRVKLYFVGNGFKCASCGKINLYTGIQNGTRGGERELEYRMMRFAAANEITISEWPFHYLHYIADKRISRASFRKKIVILQALENMRFQNIFFGKVYPQTVIRSVLKGEHPALNTKTLGYLQRYTVDFNDFE